MFSSLKRGLCGGEATRLCLAARALAGSKTPERRLPSDVLVCCGVEGIVAEVDVDGSPAGRVGEVGPVSGKNSVAVAKVGSIAPSGLDADVDGCSPKGEVRASKNWPSSLTGVKAGRTPEKLDLVLVWPFVSGRVAGMMGAAGGMTGAPLARLSRSAAALRADLEIMVAEPRDICFLWPSFFSPLLLLGVTLPSDWEVLMVLGSM